MYVIRVVVANGQTKDSTKPVLLCSGDELGLCETCVARFSCYTGELPDSIRVSMQGDRCSNCGQHCVYVNQTVECGLFGKVKGIVTIMGA